MESLEKSKKCDFCDKTFENLETFQSHICNKVIKVEPNIEVKKEYFTEEENYKPQNDDNNVEETKKEFKNEEIEWVFLKQNVEKSEICEKEESIIGNFNDSAIGKIYALKKYD